MRRRCESHRRSKYSVTLPSRPGAVTARPHHARTPVMVLHAREALASHAADRVVVGVWAWALLAHACARAALAGDDEAAVGGRGPPQRASAREPGHGRLREAPGLPLDVSAEARLL